MAYQKLHINEYFKTKVDAVQFVLEHLNNLDEFFVWNMTIQAGKSGGWSVLGVIGKLSGGSEKSTQTSSTGLDVT